MHKNFGCVVLAFLLLCFGQNLAGKAIPFKSLEQNSYVPSEILVKFKSSATDDQIEKFLGQNKLTRKHFFPQISIHHLVVPSGVDAVTFLNQIKGNPLVEYAQPNYKVHALQCTSYSPVTWTALNDPYYLGSGTQYQWNIARIQLDVASKHYVTSTARPYNACFGNPNSGTIIAIMDTGVRPNHPDLQDLTDLTTTAKILPGVNYSEGATTADDNNTDESGDYVGGHGTHVSGVAAAQSDNAAGIVGVAGNCYIMPIKVLDQNGGGSDASIIPGYFYAADHGAKVINCSFGGTTSSQAELDAVTYAYKKGCLIVAATGNDGKPTLDYPAAYPNVMPVGATDSCDKLTWFSNYGNGISVVAPGGAGDGTCSDDILSTANGFAGNPCGAYVSGSNDYGFLAGTSFSSPAVAGLAAVLFSLSPAASPDTIRTIIERTADPVDGGAAGIWNQRTGYGRINVDRAIGYILGNVSQSNSSPAGSRAYNYPNPFSPKKNLYTTIVFNVTRVEGVNFAIYDCAGRVAWEYTVPASQVTIGWYNFLRWDGTNALGQAVANGVYFCKINGGGVSVIKKLVVLK